MARRKNRYRKRKIVKDAKFGFENDGQRRPAELRNFGGETQIKHQSLPVHNASADRFVHGGLVRRDARVITVCKLSSQIAPTLDAHRRPRRQHTQQLRR